MATSQNLRAISVTTKEELADLLFAAEQAAPLCGAPFAKHFIKCARDVVQKQDPNKQKAQR